MRKLRKVLLFFVCAAITSSLVPGISACKKTGNESAGRTAERDVSENDGKNPQGGSADNDPSKEDETGDSSRNRYAIYYADGEKIGEILLENGGIGKDDLAVPEKRGYLGNWKTPTEDENGNFYIEAEYTAIVSFCAERIIREIPIRIRWKRNRFRCFRRKATEECFSAGIRTIITKIRSAALKKVRSVISPFTQNGRSPKKSKSAEITAFTGKVFAFPVF